MDGFHIDILTGGKELFIELLIVGALFFLIEKLRPAEKQIKFIKDDSRQELGFAVLNALIATPIFALLIFGVFEFLVEPLVPYQMFDEQIQTLPILLQVIMGAFILDFSTYWRHRFTHKYVWNVHSVHHAAEHLNWLTSMRLHPADVLIAVIFDLTVLYFIGFTGAGMTFAIVILKAYNYFTHANLNLQFDKPMRYIFASPNFHRWHHADEVSAYDKNFCSMFSLIDLMFGTYHHPENQLPKAYGIGKEAQKGYPKSFLGQLAYPFRKSKK